MKTLYITGNRECGSAFLETVVALALVGIVAVAILSGIATLSQSAMIADRQNMALSLAQSQLESALVTEYAYEASSYTPATLPAGDEYTGYSAVINAEPLNSPDDGIQKITVAISYNGTTLKQLEGYKCD